MTTSTHIHTFQDRGLGEAPYAWKQVVSLPSPSLGESNPTAYNNALSDVMDIAQWYGVNLGACHYCGTSLMVNHIIGDRHGRHYVVGSECVKKTGDAGLIDKVKLAERRRRAALKAKAQGAARERELEAQRERNGGLTDWQLEQRRRDQLAAELEEHNRWYIEALAPAATWSDFVQSMLSELKRVRFETLTPRQHEALADIYAKHICGHRRGSKAYDTAQGEYYDRLPPDGGLGE